MKGDVKIAETAATHSCAISHGDARDAVHKNIPSFAFVCKAYRTVQQNPQGTKKFNALSPPPLQKSIFGSYLQTYCAIAH